MTPMYSIYSMLFIELGLLDGNPQRESRPEPTRRKEAHKLDIRGLLLDDPHCWSTISEE